jgi:DNA-binding winged helix-turn-helix (wHTH) protein
MGKRVDFLNFSVDTQKHQLYQSDNRIDISSTAYKLLSYFIENPGITISRKTLTDHIWSNRIVSDTSLDKLIQRLRKILGDTGTHKDIIGTVHGEGFVFLPEVKTQLRTANSVKNKSKNKINYIFVVLALMMLVYYANTGNDKKDELPIISQAEASPIVLALIPNITQLENTKQNWMTLGGMHYFKDIFKNSLGLEIKNISLKQLGDESPERFAIDLSNKQEVDSSIIVQVQEKDEGFIGNASIRTEQGTLARQQFSSATLKTLYDDMAEWAKQQLKIDSQKNVKNLDKMMSNNRYAVENYIRGMAAQLSGDAANAIKYFDLATKEDQDFWLAWYELALSYRHQGDYQKSRAIITVLKPKITPVPLILMNAEALNDYYQGKYEKGIAILDKGILIAKKNNSLKDLTMMLTNKSLLARYLGDQDLALKSITESINVINKLPGSKYSKLGSAYNTLAGVEINLYDYRNAEKHALLAVENFGKAGNRRYKAVAKSRLAGINYLQGRWQMAENLRNEILLEQQSLDDKFGQSTSYMRLIDLALLKGNVSLVQQYLDKLSLLMANISNKYQQDGFLSTKIKYYLFTQQFDVAKEALDKFYALNSNDGHLYTYHQLQLDYYKKTQNDTAWKQQALKFSETFKTKKDYKEDSLIYLVEAEIAKQDNKLELAEDTYDLAKERVLIQKNSFNISQVFSSYILFLLEINKIDKAINLLSILEKYSLPAYPYLKVKAQVLFSNGETFKATALLQELKAKSGGHWTIDDQLLLEEYQKHN